mgnify:CR=1 FL=1
MRKWPKRVKHRNKVLAKVYRPCKGREFYRVTWYAAGKRQMISFPTYSGPGGAKEYAEKLVVELAKNSQAAEESREARCTPRYPPRARQASVRFPVGTYASLCPDLQG